MSVAEQSPLSVGEQSPLSIGEQSPLSVAGQELSALADDLPNPAWIAYADGYIFWYNRK